jgi:glucan phosphoethanolaminetransferase (alkaline phosphatase superfamily)
MNPTPQGSKGKAAFFASLAVVSVFTCFILAPLGGFIGWIFGGVATYSLFLSVYLLIPRQRFTRARHDPRQAETKAYIAFHMPILLSLFGFAFLLVLVILLLAL